MIFRNTQVPERPTTAMEAIRPDQLWSALREQCLDGKPGCDVLAIPHNPNVSGGLMFEPANPDGRALTAADAAFRSAMEPLVEMNQHKGDSECRTGFGTSDEACGFEKLNRLQLFNPLSDPNQAFPPLNYVRNALKEGLVQEEKLGENPFRFGFVGATDGHNSDPGNVEERDYGAVLDKLCPQGIDSDFENVGGKIFHAVFARLNNFGRLAFCGAISEYQNAEPIAGPSKMFTIVQRRLTIQGFIVSDHVALMGEFATEVGGLLKAGKLKSRETVIDGLAAAPQAFMGLLKGENFGKLVVKVA